MDIGIIAIQLLSFQNKLKIYHWQTSSYARHIASDSLFKSLSDKIDSFIETMQGSRGYKIILPSISSIELVNTSDKKIVPLLKEFNQWLLNELSEMLSNKEVDLLTLRDEMLAVVNKTLYLFDLN